MCVCLCLCLHRVCVCVCVFVCVCLCVYTHTQTRTHTHTHADTHTHTNTHTQTHTHTHTPYAYTHTHIHTHTHTHVYTGLVGPVYPMLFPDEPFTVCYSGAGPAGPYVDTGLEVEAFDECVQLYINRRTIHDGRHLTIPKIGALLCVANVLLMCC